MILQDLFMNLAGAQRPPAADPMDTIKGGLLAQLLGRVQASAQQPQEPDTVSTMAGFPMPEPLPVERAPDKWTDQAPGAGQQTAAAVSQLALPSAYMPGKTLADMSAPAPAAPLPAMPVKDIGPQSGFGAPYTPPPAEAAPAPQQSAPPPSGPPMGVGGPSAGQGQQFEATLGQRMRAFGRALQGGDPGDPGQAAEVKNQTLRFLVGKGMAPEEARAMVSNPALLQAALPGLFQGRAAPKIEEIYDERGRPQKILINPQTGAYKTLGGSKGDDAKAPSGFEWINPQDHSAGLKAIAGGPATHMTAELAGKLALMNAAQQGIASTKDVLLKPWGAVGAGQALASKLPLVGDIASLSGEIGIASRNVRAGIEAALRVMTGAAAPEQEVTRYMELFMPGVNDTKESATQKLGLLDQFMNNAREIVTRGRTATPGPGGAGNGAPGAGPNAPQGAAPPRDTALAEARAAIQAGKNPDAVRARLAQWGYQLD